MGILSLSLPLPLPLPISSLLNKPPPRSFSFSLLFPTPTRRRFSSNYPFSARRLSATASTSQHGQISDVAVSAARNNASAPTFQQAIQRLQVGFGLILKVL